ncbi:ABC transporter permease [Paenibacillus sp. TRM 82003]|nr:ABC transporter permease [Paenibacillus sp. TRM 82003]
MTFRALALRNVRGGWRRYAAFFLSSAAAVAIFYLFSSFIFHPDVVNGRIYGGAGVAAGLAICEGLIAIFSFFFVLYSTSAFYKTRQKEFGLLQLFGMTPGQIRRLALLEQLVVAIVAIVAGLAVGILFSKLFYMAIAELLHTDSPVRFLLVGEAVVMTSACFFLLFMIVSLFTLFRIGRQPIIDLLRASRKPKRPPFASVWLSLLSAAALGAGYYLAYTTTVRMLMPLMMPITGLVVLGTYFLFTQGSVAALGALTRRKSFYWSGARLVGLSQLVFRMKDNARIMFTASILTAVVLTAIGTVFILQREMLSQLLRSEPFAVSIEENGLESSEVVDRERLRALMAAHGIEPRTETRTVLLEATAFVQAASSGAPREIVSESSWNALAAELSHLPRVELETGEAWFADPFEPGTAPGRVVTPPGVDVTFEWVGGTATYRSKGTLHANGTNHDKRLWIVDDADFEAMAVRTPPSAYTVIYGYSWPGWSSHTAFAEEASRLTPEERREGFEERITLYREMEQFSSLTLFIGLFVGCLFFLASGSLLYFKLFTELEEDRQHYKQLQRIGMTPAELRRLVHAQIGATFLIPFVVGAVHAVFAYKLLGNALQGSLWGSGLAVIGTFFVFQCVYYAVTARAYVRECRAALDS